MTGPSVRATEQRLSRWLAPLKRIVGHSLTQLSVAGLLVVTSLFEVSETLSADVSSFRLRAAHGVLIVGLWQALSSIPDLIEGIERYFESAEKREDKS